MLELPRVLVVDDDALVCDVVRDALRPHYEVVVANSGAKALGMLRDQEFAVMIADQRMPQITGVELVTLARNLRPKLVSVILSAYTDPKVMIAAINQGQIFRFIQKPWDPHDLLLTVRQAVERYELGMQNARLVADLERRIIAFEVRDQVIAAMLTGEAEHPMGALLDRLEEIVPHEVAALLLNVPDADASLELRSKRPLSAKGATSLRDQAVELFEYFAGRPVAEEQLAIRADLQVLKSGPEASVGSQVQMPVKRGEEVIGVLILQAPAANAFVADTTRLLDRLANGTVEALAGLRAAAGKEWVRMEHALKLLPDGVIWAQTSGEIQFSNLAARQLLGAGQPLVGSIWELLGVGAEQLLDFWGPHKLLLGPEGLPTEVSAVKSTRGPFEAGGILLVLRDLSGVDEALLRQRDFLSTFSHEIRTPLSSVSAAIDLLLTGFIDNLSDKQRGYLELAKGARDGLNHMVDQLLDLERYARGAVQHEPEEIELDPWLREVVARFAPAAQGRDLPLVVEIPETAQPLLADVRRLEQVVVNLLHNALKFAAPNTPIRVCVGASARFDSLSIIGVRNQGAGIAPTELGNVFDRFWQPKRQRRAGKDDPLAASGASRGSGLGLAICRNIVEAHGGAILAASDANQTVFWAMFPKRANKESERDSGRQGPGPALRSSSGQTVSDPRGGPVWVWREDPRVSEWDLVAAAGLLAQTGLRVRFLPRDRPPRPRGGLGVVIAPAGSKTGASHSADEPPSPGFENRPLTLSKSGLPVLATAAADSEALKTLAEALGVVASQGSRELLLSVAGMVRFGSILRALGVSAAESEGGWESSASDPAAGIIELAKHLEAAEESLFPVRALCAEVKVDPLCDTFGIVRLRGLDSFRLAYGSSQARALRRALSEQLAGAVAEQGLTTQFIDLPQTVVFAASEVAMDATLTALAERFSAVAPLFYRREDRKRGTIRIGNREVMMVTIETEQLPVAAGEVGLLSAIAPDVESP